MKITPEHYQHLKSAILPFAGEIKTRREQLKTDPRVKDLETRLRWDLSFAAKLTPFICDTLYKYANDDHIDTALRQIVKEIED